MNDNRAVILLAAGQGNRLRPLTDKTPKCLLSVGREVVLDVALKSILRGSPREIVIVAGYAGDKIEQHINKYYSKVDIKVIQNNHYDRDVNILSVEVGVNALQCPHLGYTIIETDLLLADTAWQFILDDASVPHSFWVTRGIYSRHLTGGIVHVKDDSNIVDNIAYVPVFDSAYIGWKKMVGILSVGPDEVVIDRHWRRVAIQETCEQYYMIPWINHAGDLPCQILDLGEAFATSFNTVEDYNDACKSFLNLKQ